MRASLLFNPFALIERLAISSQRRRRRRRLRGTPAERLTLGHIDSLELLEMLRNSPPAVIHDIGANVGTWTCLAKSLFPDAEVEAFEPLEEHFAGFRDWTRPWSDVRLHALALGPAEGSVEIEVASFSDASSVLPLTDDGKKTFNISSAGRKKVRLATLDGLVRSGAARAPDLIKLDVQGYELEVLRGGEECMRHAKAILCEVSFRRFYEGQPLFQEVLAFLEARGFRLHAFGSSLGICEPLSQADALFLRA